jgi:periplasmic divalent cation tolerance protein
MTSAIVVLVTVGSEQEAETIATALLEERLAACVNVTSPVRSLYHWEGRIADDREWQLIIKTQERLFEALAARVRALHSYDVPEIIALPVLAGTTDYVDWIQNETKSER